MGSDLFLIVITVGVWFASQKHIYASIIDPQVYSWSAYQLLWITAFAGILIIFSIVDYWWNRDFYFGGSNDKRRHRFVFVCSPLSGDLEANITHAQLYCKTLIENGDRFGKKIVPFASHAFYTYFLDDRNSTDRVLGRHCALAFLAACDAIYVYVPAIQNKGLSRFFKKEKLDYQAISSGMKHELEEAKKLGLEIQYHRRNTSLEAVDWKPMWSPVKDDSGEVTSTNDHTYSDAPIKRVYVCTPFRGLNSGR
jgi:hypothetical protein